MIRVEGPHDRHAQCLSCGRAARTSLPSRSSDASSWPRAGAWRVRRRWTVAELMALSQVFSDLAYSVTRSGAVMGCTRSAPPAVLTDRPSTGWIVGRFFAIINALSHLKSRKDSSRYENPAVECCEGCRLGGRRAGRTSRHVRLHVEAGNAPVHPVRSERGTHDEAEREAF